MTLKSKPFWWVECDHEDCTARCPSEGDEISAWAEDDQAEDYAAGGDWWIQPSAWGGAPRHWCINHWHECEDGVEETRVTGAEADCAQCAAPVSNGEVTS